MTNLGLKTLKLFILFTKNTALVVNKPYIAFRKIAADSQYGQSVFILLFAVSYFAFATLIRIGLKNPYLLTLEFNRLIFFAGVGFLLSIALLYSVGRLFGGRGTLKSLYLTWSYTLIPTILWFFMTSLIFIFFPPPRSLSFPGKLLSIIFITLSILLLLWKIILYYLTLRFSHKLDLFRIIGVSIVLFPLFIIYGIIMYRIGIFRIPFI
ncbi:hypothetical protein A2773_01250 [Candidatus Gottesmanbacteria bacterium RIFCSPHIGHO2_01_FULL_39_10]|uniref:Yip1 domain-containing protein n=1 Tax=Candidatus Gottesmanbacteria bacterium RIFCSPHIGHO2_01_FULL_39_10 TaxID=1798375 RepID=A0A1F5ZRZ4_9BACT|nr:MAG: hypothetical protein A2773_01250 [Candidatus Gottesmanbacteria bacterium RIFCSPHIGHO2_01_FULL_39_10]